MSSSAEKIVSFTADYRDELIARARARDRNNEPNGGSFVKTARILAIQIPVPFVVQTEHGSMDAKAGDWLATNHPLDDDTSDIWPISAKRFAASYTRAHGFGTLQAAVEAEAKTLGEVAGQPVPLQEYSPDASFPASGRWAFLDSDTGDWIEVKPGVVHVSTRAARDVSSGDDRDVSHETHHELGGEG